MHKDVKDIKLTVLQYQSNTAAMKRIGVLITIIPFTGESLNWLSV